MTIRPYRSALDQAQDRLDQMKVQLEASQRDPLSVGGPALPTGAEPDLWTALGTRDLYKIIGSVPTSRDLLTVPDRHGGRRAAPQRQPRPYRH